MFPALAVILCAVLTASLLLLSQIPSGATDVWWYHIPLARSFVSRGGFAVPQIPPMLFYSSQPSFVETLYSASLLSVDDFVAANIVNVAIFFGFLFLLTSFAKRARVFQLLIVCAAAAYLTSFASSAAEPMTDLPRSCFSVGAYLFAYRYFLDCRKYDIAMSALLRGCSAASKYPELATPALIGLCLLPMIARRGAWTHLVLAMGIVLAVAGFWYLRNWITYSNPIYPFLFGHPGISDQTMAGYMEDLRRPFDIGARSYATNLLSWRGWHDFALVLYDWFLSRSTTAYVVDGLFILGVVVPGRRIWLLGLFTVLLFLLWYGVMFNSVRWAMSANLMLYCTAFVTWARLVDCVVAYWIPSPHGPAPVSIFGPGLLPDGGGLPFLLSGYAAIALLWGAVAVVRGAEVAPLPQWLSRGLVQAACRRGGIDEYQARTRVGYAMYPLHRQPRFAQCPSAFR